jgi:cysteine synthase A
MATLGLETDVVDPHTLDRTVARFRENGMRLPSFAEIADPSTVPASVTDGLDAVDPDAPHPGNLYRVHWYNGADRRRRADVPDHVVLPSSLTGVAAPILVAFGDRFPMIRAHKVLAAYACLAPRLVTGQFDPTRHRAIWPSTGNYCRGGVAISKLMGCRGVAVLPEGMSRERFEWLARWVQDPSDVIRTPGTESNVKEIYDECKRLEADPENVIFNQFSEFGNHLAHYACTGSALGRVFEAYAARHPGTRLAGFTSATGSAGTLAAGDWLKDHHGARIGAVEAVECPTLLENGFGEHNIQGIGDKHVPLIHNAMNTDFVVGVSDASTDALGVLFNSEAGRGFLADRKGLDGALITALGRIGFSGIANVLAAIKIARHLDLGPRDAMITVATDGWELYTSEADKIRAQRFGGRFDALDAAETFGRHLGGVGVDHLDELDQVGRRRIFNLGYYTWVEQQGVSTADFSARKDLDYWRGLRSLLPTWDAMIAEFNARVAKG